MPFVTGAWQIRVYELGEAKSIYTTFGDLTSALKFLDPLNTTCALGVRTNNSPAVWCEKYCFLRWVVFRRVDGRLHVAAYPSRRTEQLHGVVGGHGSDQVRLLLLGNQLRPGVTPGLCLFAGLPCGLSLHASLDSMFDYALV
jgi:hypothetical protein